MTLTTGQVIWASANGSQKFTLDVNCAVTSTVLSADPFPTGYAATQYTDVGKGECFVLPKYNSSRWQACPILTRLSSSTSSNPVTNNNTLYVKDPSGADLVCPHDDNLHAKYEFYVRL